MYKDIFLLLFLIVFTVEIVVESKHVDIKNERSSLVFVFDTTGSMHNDLEQLREGAEMILDTALEHSNIISNFVFVPFNDPVVGPPTVTQDKEVFKSALNMIRIRGGGDCPEKSLGGILMALKVSLPGSYIYVLTDATAGDHRILPEVLDAVQRKQSQVVFVLTGHCNDLVRPHYQVYQKIAAASFGQVFHLNKTNVHDVLDFVRSSIQARAVNLGSAVNPAGYNYTRSIPVDSSLVEVTVSVAGAAPHIHVTSPSGTPLEPPRLLTPLSLDEVKIVKVLEPEAGNWTVSVGSTSRHSVRVGGLSNLTFQHAFSVHAPEEEEGNNRPLLGTLNYMAISLSETDTPITISHAELLDLEGKTLFEIPLRLVDENKKIYVTDAFMPPEDLFFVAINGRDETNQEIRRVSTTTIQAKPPEVPYITVNEDIDALEHERVVLNCYIESLVPVTAYWSKDYTDLANVSSLQSTQLQYVIEDVLERDSGAYTCRADNLAGSNKASTNIYVSFNLPIVSIRPGNMTIMESENLTISCTVYSEWLYKIEVKLNGKILEQSTYYTNPAADYYTFNTTIESIPKNSGEYACFAENNGGEAKASTYITILPKPKAHIGLREIKKNAQSDLQLHCAVDADTVQWLRPNGSVVREEVMIGGNVSVLNLSNVTLLDEGYWECKAFRRGYEDFDTVKLTISYKPQVVIDSPENVTLIYGTDYNITCNVLAKPQPQDIAWHKDNGGIIYSKIQKVGLNQYSSVLTLRNISETSEGNYSCYSENSEGFDMKRVSAHVRKYISLIAGFTDQVAELNAQVTLNCSVDAHPKPHTIWRLNNTILNRNDNIEISSDNSTLVIKNVGLENLGEYSCTVMNDYEVMVVNGSVFLPDTEIPLLSKEPVERVTMKGKSALVTCRIIKGKPKPKITWLYKNHSSQEFSNLTQDKAYLLSEDRLQLMIKNVDIGHAGFYRCEAENYVGKDVYDSKLVVRYAPQLHLERDSEYDKPMQVRTGEKIQLTCKASGEPRPIVTWTKEHGPMAYSNNVYLTEDNALMISKATEYDSGVYTCSAASALGSSRRDFIVIVYEPPTILLPSEPTIEVLEGQLVELPCVVSGSPPPDVQWRQRGDAISERRKYIDDDFTLRFVANLTDFGEYTCVAANAHGNASVTYNVYVWVPPYIRPPLKSSEEVLDGSDITLTCDAVGFPIPSIVWAFQDKLLTANTSHLSFNDFGNIFISNASDKHRGMYSCIADNDVGAAKKTITLDVLEPPMILSENYTGPYIATTLDLAVTISCRTRGTPRPFVAWSKDGHYLDIDNRYDINFDGSLTIKSPSEDLSGNYTCVAKNKVGVTNKTMEVQIYPLPTMMQSDSPQSTLSVLEGTSPTVQCPVCTTHCTVKWYKDAQLITVGNLTFTNISRNNASTYACTVSNTVGSAHSTVRIDVEWQPRFVTVVNETVLVVRGEDSVLDCTVDAKPVGEIEWLFNSKPLPGEDKEYLKLRNVKLQHTGLYKCVVSNAHGVIMRRFTLDVLVPPFISDFEVLDVTLKEGINATLDCNANGYPKPNVTWTYKNSYWHLTNGSLRTYNASASASGAFRCDASNMAARAHLVYNVIVVAGPSVEVRMDGIVTNVVAVELTKPTRITCHATGNPTPRIQWLQHGNTIATSTHDAVLLELEVTGVPGSVPVVYHCVASNEGGTDVAIVQVYTLEPPIISTSLYQETNLTNSTTLEVLSGSPFYLTCYGSGYPEPSLHWYKDGNPLIISDESIVLTDFGEILVSNKAKCDQSGTYLCVAMNKVGEAKFEYLVDVLEPPPKPSANIPLIRISKGQPLKLSCPQAGNPVANVTWIKRGRVLNEYGVTLIINNTRTTDTGHYTCILTNKVGSTEFAFNVRVEVAPSIAMASSEMAANESSLTVKLGSSAVLRCLVDGEPKPQVVWYKNSEPLSTGTDNVQTAIDNRIVTIWRTTTDDAGLYQCVAENSAGKASWNYKVIVLAPGKWTPFSTWSLCNVTCGVGYQHRSRMCVYTSEQVLYSDNRSTIEYRNTDYRSINNVSGIFVVVEETTCKGKREEGRKCRMPDCEDDASPRWSSWSHWSACSSECGAGSQTRTRRCRGGTHCTGDNVQIRKCPHLPKCSQTEHDSPNDVLHSISNTHVPEATYELDPYESTNFEDVETIFEQPYSNLMKLFEVEGVAVKENGPCGVGFTYHEAADSCEDIDECLIRNNQCHSTQACENVAGAYRCLCPEGYGAGGAGQRCLDINECSTGTHWCEFACVNTAGGHVCACPPAMRLRSDRRTCYTPTSYRRQVEEVDSDFAGISIDIPAKYMKLSRSEA